MLELPSRREFQNHSCFNRDRDTWISLSDQVFWALAQHAVSSSGSSVKSNSGFMVWKAEGEGVADGAVGSHSGTQPTSVRCWSCGCSSGEEAYYLRMVWQRRLASIFPEVIFTVLGTDSCADSIAVAREGAYTQHSLQGLPLDWRHTYFESDDSSSRVSTPSRVGSPEPHWITRDRKMKLAAEARLALLREVSHWTEADAGKRNYMWRLSSSPLKDSVSFVVQDAFDEMPAGPFDLILCRYAICLYSDAKKKAKTLAGIVERLRPGGFLVIGETDKLPLGFDAQHGLSGLHEHSSHIFQRAGVVDQVQGQETMDARLKVSTYSEYLRSRGSEPDWVASQAEVFRHFSERKMTGNSRMILARAASMGRWDDCSDHLSRFAKDVEARRQRHADRVRLTDFGNTPQSQQALTKDEATSRVNSFLTRVAQWQEKQNASQQERDRIANWSWERQHMGPKQVSGHLPPRLPNLRSKSKSCKALHKRELIQQQR